MLIIIFLNWLLYYFYYFFCWLFFILLIYFLFFVKFILWFQVYWVTKIYVLWRKWGNKFSYWREITQPVICGQNNNYSLLYFVAKTSYFSWNVFLFQMFFICLIFLEMLLPSKYFSMFSINNLWGKIFNAIPFFSIHCAIVFVFQK